MTMLDAAAPRRSPRSGAGVRTDSWRRRLIRTLLYGENVNRPAKARARLGLMMLAFALIYLAIAGRLVNLATSQDGDAAPARSQDAVATARPDILDRHGDVLAIDVRTPSLYAEPHHIIDVDEAVEALTAVMPDLDANDLRERLSGKRRFIWLRREITQEQREQIYSLGLPGIGFLLENKRYYPNGAEAAHVLGFVDVDNQGRAGMERWLDGSGLAALHAAGLADDRLQKPVELALDLRVQHALRDELVKARAHFKAIAASGIVTDVRTGEIIAMVSLPDYDPNDPGEAIDDTRINRLTTGVYEMGSTFKALTVAMALDSGKVTLDSTFDARTPLRFGSFTIHDYHPEGRVLTLPEVFTYSSNIGAARMALSLGVKYHQQFLGKLGQLDRLRTELPEGAAPLLPKNWSEISTATIAFGHGMSVAPLQAVMAVSALVNGGHLIAPTFLKRSEAEAMAGAKQVISARTSAQMRYLMRLNAEKGTATNANVAGYYVGGKTGTSEKVVNGQYAKHRLLNSFTAILPADQPRFQLLVMLDEPQPVEGTHGYATSGWNAAPTAGKVIARIAPLLDVAPRFNLPPAGELILASAGQSR